ncbi:hypothetical protein KLMA_10750 [Kluyveromyces marxianus DMKU3-1042]|mgnify:CR=1 FL=1|uniref:Uncharacterized protein n=1 Tax=Kluyveromyces marxianus (strain DMKU3-1042 / BCC 29191 / NBRC 104275) TaxID=1003335 RepID=W0T457_KLUMD|nr:hypothetical protein KLMA_10750 [Kluyveromyces marxianus DMKU3-1042]BAO38372.1 hypothetical protein KLMA_10750 [Kluyveromyces marxianus DMKU3-1042]
MQLRRSTRLRTTNSDKDTDTDHISDDELVPALIPTLPVMDKRIRENVNCNDIGSTSGPNLHVKEARIKQPLPTSECLPDPNIEIDEKFIQEFDTVIQQQTKLFYKNLSSPQYVNYNSLEIFKSPEDKTNLENISRQLSELLPILNRDTDAELKTLLQRIKEEEHEAHDKSSTSPDSSLLNLLEYQPNVTETDDSKLIQEVAKIHKINISDISEMLITQQSRHLKRSLSSVSNQSKKQDISLVINKCTRLLTKERDHALPWPTKKRKKNSNLIDSIGRNANQNSHENIPLMS